MGTAISLAVNGCVSHKPENYQRNIPRVKVTKIEKISESLIQLTEREYIFIQDFNEMGEILSEEYGPDFLKLIHQDYHPIQDDLLFEAYLKTGKELQAIFLK